MKQLFEENEFLKLEETEFESKDTGEVLFFLITCFLGIVTIYIYTYIHICSNKYDNLRRN